MKVSDTQDPALRTYTLKESRAATMSRHPVIPRALACGVATVAVAALGLVPAVAAARTPSATRLPAASWALRAIVRGGQDYALSGKTLLVNAVDGRDVYVFNDGPTGWRQVAELEKPSDLSKNTAFGVGAISGDVAVLPAPEAHNGQGRAYVFSSSGGTWHQVQELESPHPISNGGQFGSGVDISGGTIVVGA
ncbi:MAG TPA: hypothetical protein VK425_02700, partial [Acidimicrobiales bacterium]|nr:hypothetical protein [Acidimicrobiales bacterium]